MPCEVGTTLKIDSGRFDLNLGSRALVHRQSVEKIVKDCCARIIKKNEDTKSSRKWVSILSRYPSFGYNASKI